jgi:poly-D-alanine transfer protein DltD
MVSGNVPINKEWLSQIGEIQKTDLFVWGTANKNTAAFVDLSGYSEYNDFITYDGNKYLIRDVTDLPSDAGQVARLVRREA